MVHSGAERYQKGIAEMYLRAIFKRVGLHEIPNANGFQQQINNMHYSE